MHDKRYQIFISSTYDDLKVERSEVMQALLELDCMPGGMELFPSANEEQWNWIRKVIDESDYYLVIVANRYGSVSDQTGMSYTEMEYRYAADIGKPTIAFLHEDPTGIEAKRSEQSQTGKRKLAQFRKLCETRLVKYWNSPVDLGAKVSRSLTQLIKHEPAIGWVRADKIPEDQSAVILRLRDEISGLKSKLKESSARSRAPDNLACGTDQVEIDFSYQTKKAKTGKNGQAYWVNDDEHDGSLRTTWDDLFSCLAPDLINPASEYRIVSCINNFIEGRTHFKMQEMHPDKKIETIRIYSNVLDQIKVQLRALGLIEIEYGNDWVLTEHGDQHMIELLAQKKAEPSCEPVRPTT
ncbi:DUF4062 domain-containing protein [Rosistilla oblonga]|uniref:DUF4062 domain-containing protein n=1 Tax=Rosistilla oblonga TaxID=2527990 RepID=A0A518J1A0_9BACT|nr:DUF4062 domain-containing protein [Rosistilla oblonga]QDV59108.1 hypothetical protein Mal33_51340 [Rosistilla oblonga]